MIAPSDSLSHAAVFKVLHTVESMLSTGSRTLVEMDAYVPPDSPPGEWSPYYVVTHDDY